MPDSMTPYRVASFVAIKRLSNFGLKATENAQSIIKPSTCEPKSILQTSSYSIVVKSPLFGV